MEVIENGVSEPAEFTPCSICGRTFNPEVLVRHERVCSKNQKLASKRPVFDTSRKRREGTDLQSFLASHPYLKDKKPSTAELRASQKKNNWRRKHEDFINSIRSARDYTEDEMAGKRVPPPRPSQSNPDYVQCPYCARRFEEYAAERHVPFCKERHSRIERRPQENKAMEKLNKRIQYKPPKLKKKNSDQDTPSKMAPHGHPPGYHLVSRRSNFGGTYNLSEDDSPERRSSYQSPYRAGGRDGGIGARASVPKSLSHRMATTSTQARELPGSSSGNPLTRDVREREDIEDRSLYDDKQIRRQRSQLKTPQPMVPPPAGNHRGQGLGAVRERGVRRVRQIRGVCESDGDHHSSTSSFGGDREAPRLGPVKPKGKSRALRVRDSPPPPSNEDCRFDFYNSGSMSEVRGGSGSSLSGRKGVPLNQHGMAMGKFCYECGARYPVPQAKYCCECGTKRI